MFHALIFIHDTIKECFKIILQFVHLIKHLTLKIDAAMQLVL